MNVFKKWIGAAVRTATNLAQGNGLSQDSTFVVSDEGVAVDASATLRACAAEGVVLLRNQDVLPLKPTTRIALFGRHQVDWFYVGYGSGGDINPPYKINLLDAGEGRLTFDLSLAERYRRWCRSPIHAAEEGWWGAWPRSHPEMPLKDKEVAAIAASNDVAVYVLGRSAGEDRENVLAEGAYFLTSTERSLLRSITAHFARTIVVLDAGNVIDMSWVEEYQPSAVLLAYFGGQESCTALVDVLLGDVNPSGKLPDTIAARYQDYPSSSSFGNKNANEYREDIYVGYRYFETFARDKVLYPFGFGLSYTRFEWEVLSTEASYEGANVTVRCTNVGAVAGKEVMQLYLSAPQGRLGKSALSLVAFAKTPRLAVGESATLSLRCSGYAMASFDDTGVTGYPDGYVLEEGAYTFFVGNSVRDVVEAARFDLPHTVCLKSVQSICPVARPFDRLMPKRQGNVFVPSYAQVPLGKVDTKARILAALPDEVERSPEPVLWTDVLDGHATVEQFVRSLDLADLEALTRGHGFVHSPLGVSGNCGAMGGVTPDLRLLGFPPIAVCDGPSGIRANYYCNLAPCGTCLAATWNVPLVTEVYRLIGREMVAHGVHVLLGGGMNIHRNPLCGRNFEYMSEDPVLTGLIAAATVEGVQENGVAACVKHLCCNNQEYNRSRNDSRVSQRALREIYLKGFEICVELADPWTLMTSYNMVNGVWSHYNYDLATTLLREEWGYRGLIMTDWWMQHDHSHEFPALYDNAYRVRAGVDVYMPGDFDRTTREYRADDSLLTTVGQPNGLRRAEIERCALDTARLAYRLREVLAPTVPADK